VVFNTIAKLVLLIVDLCTSMTALICLTSGSVVVLVVVVVVVVVVAVVVVAMDKLTATQRHEKIGIAVVVLERARTASAWTR
jgi:hypothetical protein